MTRRVLPFFMLLFLAACASTSGRNRPIRMLASGPPGVVFTCHYEFGPFKGSVRTATSGGGFDTFLEMPAGDGYCEITKDRPTDELSIVASEGRGRRFNGFVPSGSKSMRFIRESGVWRHEVGP